MKQTVQFALLTFVLLTVSTAAGAANLSQSSDTSAALELLKTSIKEMQRQDSLLAGYCYFKTVLAEVLNNDLSRGKSEERLLEVTSIPHGPDIEVLVALNGKRISEKEKQKRETEQKKRAGGQTQLQLGSEDLITQFDWSFAGAEQVNNRPSTVLCFKPKPGAVYTGKDQKAEKFIRKVSGHVWVDDAEHAISRIEFRSTGPVKSMAGVLWTLNSFFVREERKRLPEGVWIDSAGEYFFDATALVVKRILRRSTMHTHDYARCTEPAPTSRAADKQYGK